MRFLGNTRLFQAAALAAWMVALGAGDALAMSRGSWGSSGSYGSYGSSGSSASYASYGSYGSSGSSASYASYGSSGSSASYGSASSGGRAGLFSRWEARKAARACDACYASSGSYGSYGSYGSSGSSASYGGYAVVSYAPACCDSCGSSGYMEGAPVEGTHQPSMGQPGTQQPNTGAEPTPSQPTPPTGAGADANIRVLVPEDANVFVNDAPTTTTGTERHYISRGLRGGLTYSYQLRVEFARDGKPVVENKLVSLRAGQSVELAFGGEASKMVAEDAANTEPAKTELKLHVPAEAKVTLAGAETHQTGELRTYATVGLTAGQTWDAYVVRVEVQQDGQTLVREKTLKIEGGQNYDLTFDFSDEAAHVASAN